MTATLPRSPGARFTAAARRRRWLSGPVLVIALAVVTLIGGLGYVALGTDLLAVRTVTVTGGHDDSTAAVLAAAQVPVGTPMVLLDPPAIGQRVTAALPDVASVDVLRSWPSTVRLVVHERVAFAVVASVGRFVLIDRSGVPFRFVTVPPAGVAVVELGHPAAGDPATRAALEVLRALPPDLRRLLVAVAAPGPAQVTLRLRGGREVLWGGPEDSGAKVAVVRVLLKRPGRHLDVSAPGLVTIR